MHADADIEGVPWVDTQGMDIPGVDDDDDDDDDDSINGVATGAIPGVRDPSANDSVSDSDEDEHHPIYTQSGRAVHSTQSNCDVSWNTNQSWSAAGNRIFVYLGEGTWQKWLEEARTFDEVSSGNSIFAIDNSKWR